MQQPPLVKTPPKKFFKTSPKLPENGENTTPQGETPNKMPIKKMLPKKVTTQTSEGNMTPGNLPGESPTNIPKDTPPQKEPMVKMPLKKMPPKDPSKIVKQPPPNPPSNESPSNIPKDTSSTPSPTTQISSTPPQKEPMVKMPLKKMPPKDPSKIVKQPPPNPPSNESPSNIPKETSSTPSSTPTTTTSPPQKEPMVKMPLKKMPPKDTSTPPPKTLVKKGPPPVKKDVPVKQQPQQHQGGSVNEEDQRDNTTISNNNQQQQPQQQQPVQQTYYSLTNLTVLKAKVNFTGDNATILTVSAGDTFALIERTNGTWWKVFNMKSGQQGFLLLENAEMSETRDFGTGKALGDFTGNRSYGQIDLKKDSTVKIFIDHKNGWITGECVGCIGFFPSNYIKVDEESDSSDISYASDSDD